MNKRCDCGSRQRHKCTRHGGGKMCVAPTSIPMDFERKLVEDADYREAWVEKELVSAGEYFKRVVLQGDDK